MSNLLEHYIRTGQMTNKTQKLEVNAPNDVSKKSFNISNDNIANMTASQLKNHYPDLYNAIFKIGVSETRSKITNLIDFGYSNKSIENLLKSGQPIESENIELDIIPSKRQILNQTGLAFSSENEPEEPKEPEIENDIPNNDNNDDIPEEDMPSKDDIKRNMGINSNNFIGDDSNVMPSKEQILKEFNRYN